MAAENRTTIIKSALTVLTVLQVFGRLPEEASLAEVATEVGMPKMKTFRSLNTLVHAGFLSQNPANRKYRLHYPVLELARKLLDQQSIRAVSHEALQNLAIELGEDITVAVLDQHREEVVFIERLRGGARISFFCDVGKRLPLHVGAAAKSIMAHLPRDQFEAYLQSFVPARISPYTIIQADELRRQRDQIQEKGYAFSDQEVDEGVAAVGACIVDAAGYPAAGIAIASVSIKMTPDRITKLGNILRETTANISAQLGYIKD
jgi:DNA-binding IclR family transcriptional regulator